MTKDILFTPYGGINVKVDTTYDYTNVPAEADIVKLTRGQRIKDEFGNDTKIRGVRVLITTSGLTQGANPIDNVPIVWHEGDAITFSPDGVYKFLDDGIIAYGKKAVV